MNTFRIIYLTLQLLRVVCLPLFFINPLLGWVVVIYLDIYDYGFALRSGVTYRTYQNIDKTIDMVNQFYFVIAAWYFNWEVFYVIVGLFLFRIVGNIFYYSQHEEKFLFYFPNALEVFFAIYYTVRFVIIGSKLSASLVGVLVVLSVVLKLVHEYYLHLYGWIDTRSLEYLKKHPEHLRKIPQKYLS